MLENRWIVWKSFVTNKWRKKCTGLRRKTISNTHQSVATLLTGQYGNLRKPQMEILVLPAYLWSNWRDKVRDQGRDLTRVQTSLSGCALENLTRPNSEKWGQKTESIMSASGRKRTVISLIFESTERPLSGKADIQDLSVLAVSLQRF